MEQPHLTITPLNYIQAWKLYTFIISKINAKNNLLFFFKSQENSEQSQENQYKQLIQYGQVYLKNPILKLKIIRLGLFQKDNNLNIQKQVKLGNEQQGQCRISLGGEGDQQEVFWLQYKVINGVHQQNSSIMMFLKQKKHEGYEKFLEFRKKVKRLQNLTSPLNYKITHRIRIDQLSNIQNTFIKSQLLPNPLYLHLPQTIINTSTSKPLRNPKIIKITLEEILSLSSQQNNSMSYALSQTIVNQPYNKNQKIKSNYNSWQFNLVFNQYLKLYFVVQSVRIRDIRGSGLLSIRFLDTPINIKTLQVGLVGENLKQTIQPIFTTDLKNYYDKQYYYLQKNIHQIGDNLDISQKTKKQNNKSILIKNCKHFFLLKHLTAAFPDYPHFQTQILLPILPQSIINLKYELFNINQEAINKNIKIPLHRLLEGLNIIDINQQHPIHIYTQFLTKSPKIQVPLKNKIIQQKKFKKFSLNFLSFWNLNSLMLQTASKMYIKIFTTNLQYSIPFKISYREPTKIQDNQIRKQIQKLQARTQINLHNLNVPLINKSSIGSQFLNNKQNLNSIIVTKQLKKGKDNQFVYRIIQIMDISQLILLEQRFDDQLVYVEIILNYKQDNKQGKSKQLTKIVGCGKIQFQSFENQSDSRDVKIIIQKIRSTQQTNTNPPIKSNRYSFLTFKYEQFDRSNNKTNVIQKINNKNIFATSIEHNTSIASLFTFAFSLQSIGQLDSNQQSDFYQLILQSIQQNKQKNKIYKKRIQKLLYDNRNRITSFQKAQFLIYARNGGCQFNFKIQKKYYDQFIENNVYKIYLQKRIRINGGNNNTLNNSQDHVFLTINSNSYQVIQFTFIDQNDKNKTSALRKIKLQILHKKQNLLDREKGCILVLKIIKGLWQNIRKSYQGKDYTELKIQVMQKKKIKKNKKKQSKTANLKFMNQTQLRLGLSDYRDSLAITMGVNNQKNQNQQTFGYSKIYQIMKVGVSFLQQDKMMYNQEGQWMLANMNVGTQCLQFLMRFQQNQDDGNSSARTQRTISRDQKSQKKKINNKQDKSEDLNKTTRQQDVIQVKKWINIFTLQNRKLLTKLVRLENKNTLLSQKLEQLREIGSRKKQQFKIKKSTNSIQNTKLYRSICGCGQKNPKYMGYCQKCVKRLRNEYAIINAQFIEKAKDYESQYYKKILKNEKTIKLETKIKNLKNKLFAFQQENELEVQQQQFGRQKNMIKIRGEIAEVKNEIFGYKLKTRNITQEGDELQKKLEDKINKINKDIFNMMKQIQELRNKNQEFQGIIKNRYQR